MSYIAEQYPEYLQVYKDIYERKDMGYWKDLEAAVKTYAMENGLTYLVNDLPYGRSPKGKPVIVNYFYHEKIRQRASSLR